MFNLGELLSLGYLQDGDVIYWKRPRMGLTHFATIKRGGEVVTSDGTVYRSPSGAARHYYQKPIDGWYNWRLERTGQRLDEVRENAMGGKKL
jgi:hypothetical protein